MAKVGTAYVEIKPDLSGFAADLKAKLAKVKAEKAVTLTVSTRGFAAAVKAALGKVANPSKNVTLTPVTTGFTRAARTVLAKVPNPSKNVTLTPVTTGFFLAARRALAKVATPTKTVDLNVRVDRGALRQATRGIAGVTSAAGAGAKAAGQLGSALTGMAATGTKAAIDLGDELLNMAADLIRQFSKATGSISKFTAFLADIGVAAAPVGAPLLAILAIVAGLAVAWAGAMAAGAAFSAVALVTAAVVSTLAAAIAACTSAVVALMGALGAVAAVAIVLMVVFKPIVEALQDMQAAASGSEAAVKKLEESMGKLTPVGRTTVRILDGLRSNFEWLSRELQNALLPAVNGLLLSFKDFMPVLVGTGKAIAVAMLPAVQALSALMKDPAFRQSVTQIAGGFALFIKAIGAAGVGSIDKLVEAFGTMMTVMGPVAQSFGGLIGSVAGGIAAFMRAFSNPEAMQAVARILDGLGLIIEDVLTILGDFGAELAMLVAPDFLAFWDSLKTVIGPILEIFKQFVSSGIMKAFTLFMTSVGQGFQTLADSGIFEKLSGAMGETVIKLGDAFVQLVNALVPHLPALIDGILQLTLAFIAALPALLPLIPPLIQLALLIIQQVVPALPLLTQIISFMIGLMVTWLQFFVLVAGWTFTLLALIGKLIDWVGANWTPFWKAFGDFVKQTWENVKKRFNEAVDAITGVVDRFLKWISETWNGALDDVQELIDKFWKWVSQAFTTARTALTTAITTLWTNIKTGFTTGIDTAVKLVTGLPGKITNALSGLGTLLTGLGGDMIEGLFAGIADMGDWLEKNVLGFITDHIPKALRGLFEIGSPSKLMAREIGKPIVQGVAVGMDKALPTLERQVVEVAKTAVPVVPPFATSMGLGGLDGLGVVASPVYLRVTIGDTDFNDMVDARVSEWDADTAYMLVKGRRGGY